MAEFIHHFTCFQGQFINGKVLPVALTTPWIENNLFDYQHISKNIKKINIEVFVIKKLIVHLHSRFRHVLC
jgi:hypothetical protein